MRLSPPLRLLALSAAAVRCSALQSVRVGRLASRAPLRSTTSTTMAAAVESEQQPKIVMESEQQPKIVIAGAGLHGAALAYFLTKRGAKPVVIEKKEVAAAASGKGGGFLARD